MKWYITNKQRHQSSYCGSISISKLTATDNICYTTVDASAITVNNTTVTDKFDELEKKIKALEARIKLLESGQTLP